MVILGVIGCEAEEAGTRNLSRREDQVKGEAKSLVMWKKV